LAGCSFNTLAAEIILSPETHAWQAINHSQVILPISPSQWAFKVIKLKKLSVEDLHLALRFLTF
jgi:hypothetical protein